jgi:hypothetical protein
MRGERQKGEDKRSRVEEQAAGDKKRRETEKRIYEEKVDRN